MAFGRFRVLGAAVGTILFSLRDLYGMHWLAVPYYAGMIGHRASGALAALHMSDFRVVGFRAAFGRLAVSKCALLSQPVLIAMWILYLVGTTSSMALMFAVAARAKRSQAGER